MAHALDAIGREAFTPARREFVARRRAVIAANPELQEREALKGLGLIASMTDALKRRGVPDLTARVAAELGALAWKIAYERWIDTPDGDDFGEIARRTLGEVQAASAVLTAALPETNGERARRGYEAVLRGDLDAVREFLDPDVKWHGGDPNARGACRSRDEALAFIGQAQKRGRIGELVDVIEAGDRVVVIMRPAARAPNAQSLVANLTTFRDGRAVEMVHYPDPADALTALGAS